MANPFDEFDNVESNPFDTFDEEPKKDKFLSHKEKQKAIEEGLAGMLDTGMGMVSSLPGQLAGGIWGLSTLASGQGLEKAAGNVEKAMESNFGMGAYKPFTKKGQEYTEKAGEALQKPIDLAGKGGQYIGGDLGETNARIAAEALMNLIEPGAALGLAKGAIRRAGKARPEAMTKEPVPGVKVVEPAKNPFDQFDQATAEKLAAGDETGQMALFDQPELMGQRNQYNAGDLGDWRVDENGIPVRVDKSMDAANVEAPLQRNLFGDELPQAGLEGTNVPITQAIDNTPANGMWAQRRGMTNRLGGNAAELMATPELEAAMMEANGMKLPFDEQTAFDPKNPLPTEKYGDMLKRTESQTALAARPLDIGDRPPIVDSVDTPRSPEMIAARAQKRDVAARIPSKNSALSEFEPVRTKEEAIAMAAEQGFKDNAPGVLGRNLGSGINYAAATTNNPLIKFANTEFRDARTAAENFSKTYVTAKDGISPTWSKLNDVEKNRVREALLEGDKHQMRITDADMIQRGFSDLERNLVNKYYEANEAMFKRWNQVLAEQGLAPVNRREGHVPGIFKGAYKALVTDEKGVTGVIAADSKYELAAAKKYFAEKHPTYKVVDQGRKGLASYKNQSDIFSGMNDILTLLAENDPRFREVQNVVSEAIKHGNNSIYAFNKHELSKKGVVGNEGNKPWLDAKKNTDAWFKSMVQYFEEGALHHELQKPLADIRTLANDKQLNMPKTMEYLDSYTKHVTGQNANNPVASFANAAIDLGPKLLGFGPRQTLQVAGALKNRMSQLFMGWGNYVFTGAQMMQPLQTGLPMMQLAAGRLGSSAYTPKAMFNGGNAFMLSSIERMTGKNLGKVIPDYQREAFKYAEDRGLLNFSEMEKAYEGQKSKFARGVDKVAEFNMKVGELGTRTPMFMSFVDMLHHNGIPMDRALPIAENMTQLAMIDYHQWERPQAYGKLGTLGQFAGGLTTFKHGYMGQQVKLAKELGRDGNIVKNAAPIGLSAAAMVALAGLTGVPFYDELDEIFGALTDKFGGKRENIREAFLKNLPEWSKSGAISNATNVAVQTKFSSANMVPDNLAKAASPHLEAFGKIIGDAIDVARYGDDQAWANLMMDITPSTFKGLVEDKMFKTEDGKVLNRERQATVDRSPEGWELRKWTGLRPNDEVVQREADFKARQAEMADTDAKKKIAKDFGRSILNDRPATEKLQEYQERGGDPKSLLNIFKQKALEKKLTEEQRRNLQIKPTIGSMRKQDYYNKPGER
jgi:hypothetical protein